jgi:hypothetical protein
MDTTDQHAMVIRYIDLPSGSVDLTAATNHGAELAALQAVIAALQDVDVEARRRIMNAAATFLDVGDEPRAVSPRPVPAVDAIDDPPSYPSFSADTSMSPKEFLFQKQPRTDVERIAALAYYLTHYLDTPHFKTLDLSKLNTEAAQPKFSNAANSANNAVKQGYLVPTTKGQRQISAAGERFVAALPDRDAARAAMAVGAPKRRPRRSGQRKA